MSQFLQDFKLIIRQADYTNTYKMAWAKALVEISNEYRDETGTVTIHLSEIAKCMIKYYWNQTIFFNLVQGSNLSTTPLLIQYVKELIRKYRDVKDDYHPVVFERALPFIEDNLFSTWKRIISKTVTALKKDVSYRFIFLNKKNYTNLYKYERGSDTLLMEADNLHELHVNEEDLYDLINYRWSLILESFNSSPRINKKVRIIDESDVKRSNLQRFDKYLDLENKEHICFICGKKIEDKDLSRDHVIPWSYLYSDDLWNIVFVHKSCNSSKSNIIPDKKAINKLKDRNIRLQKILHNEGISDKNTDELELAIEKDFVDQFYIGCKQ